MCQKVNLGLHSFQLIRLLSISYSFSFQLRFGSGQNILFLKLIICFCLILRLSLIIFWALTGNKACLLFVNIIFLSLILTIVTLEITLTCSFLASWNDLRFFSKERVDRIFVKIIKITFLGV